MKNNEILLTLKFEGYGEEDTEFLLLVDKGITTTELDTAIKNGLENRSKYGEKYASRKMVESFIVRRLSQEINRDTVKINDKKSLCDEGFVTTTAIIIMDDSSTEKSKKITKPFAEINALSSLRGNPIHLEYNISSRRIVVPESNTINVGAPGNMPTYKPQGILSFITDMIIPSVISVSSLFAARAVMSFFGDNPNSFPMLAMTATTAISTISVQIYNSAKRNGESKAALALWKSNCEQYISDIYRQIAEWQDREILYLRTLYPNSKEIHLLVSNIDKSIFSRSVNDKDFMMITLGESDQVKPSLEIEATNQDTAISNVKYRIDNTGKVKVLTSSSQKNDNTFRQLANIADDFKNHCFEYLLPRKTSGNDKLPPLVIDFKKSGVLGIVAKLNESINISKNSREYAEELVKNIILNLVYNHSPEDLQLVFFFENESNESKQRELIENYKYLPHANELFEDSSQFVFDKSCASEAFDKLQAIMRKREHSINDKEEEDNSGIETHKFTQIVCIMFEDYDIGESGFSNYLPKPPVEGEEYKNKYGISFIYITKNISLLPRYCGHIIEIETEIDKTDNKKTIPIMMLSERYNVIPHERLKMEEKATSSEERYQNNSKVEAMVERRQFRTDLDRDTTDEKNDFHNLSAIFYRRIAPMGNIPSKVGLVELLPSKIIQDYIKTSWSMSNVTKSLAVPIGRNEYGPVMLDLHEKGDGPHMLVAGTTGSGKSETVISYLVSLCATYSPMDLNLMLVDMKGGGFSNRLKDLPHCVGVVDDVAGEDEGFPSTYMLKRFLEVLNAEIKRRKICLSEFGVDNIDAYIEIEKKLRNAFKEDYRKESGTIGLDNIAQKHSLNTNERIIFKNFMKENRRPEPLSHLVLVVDEFTELKRFSSESSDTDYITEITTIARVGRTLGFHIILVSQNIEGAITEDIRINSNARICLKVATSSASKEMLDGRADAYYQDMPCGRAYLMSNNGRKYVYFQSAYTGEPVDKNNKKRILVKEYVPNGEHKVFYDSMSTENNADNNQQTELNSLLSAIKSTVKDDEKPRQIFLPPLKKSDTYKDDTEWN